MLRVIKKYLYEMGVNITGDDGNGSESSATGTKIP